MKTVIILTMPRSGSSLLAGILHRLGVWMGKEKDILKGRHLNKYGCYENQSLLTLNHNILLNSNRLLNYSRRFNDDDCLVESTVKKFEGEIKKVLRENERELWGWKDAAIIYALPYLHKYLTNPHYICLKRNIESVADSQSRAARLRNWLPHIKLEFSYFPPHKWFVLFFRSLMIFITKGNIYRTPEFLKRVIIDGYERIERFVIDKKHLEITLDDLLNDSEKIIQKIIAFLEITPSPEQYKAALGFIYPELLTS